MDGLVSETESGRDEMEASFDATLPCSAWADAALLDVAADALSAPGAASPPLNLALSDPAPSHAALAAAPVDCAAAAENNAAAVAAAALALAGLQPLIAL